jgi:spore coat polysaccharide biosynthesis predicted glycosyltransferase SpsG
MHEEKLKKKRDYLIVMDDYSFTGEAMRNTAGKAASQYVYIEAKIH